MKALSIVLFAVLAIPATSAAEPIVLTHFEIDLSSLQMTFTFAGQPFVETTRSAEFTTASVGARASGFLPQGSVLGQPVGQISAAVPGASAVVDATLNKMTADLQATPIHDVSSADFDMNYRYNIDVENVESVAVSMNYIGRIDLRTDNPGETADAFGYRYMRLLEFDSPTCAPGCVVIDASRLDFVIGGGVSNGADLTRVLDSPFTLFYAFGTPFSGRLAIDGGTNMTAVATSVPEPSTFALTGLGALLCMMRRRHTRSTTKSETH